MLISERDLRLLFFLNRDLSEGQVRNMLVALHTDHDDVGLRGSEEDVIASIFRNSSEPGFLLWKNKVRTWFDKEGDILIFLHNEERTGSPWTLNGRRQVSMSIADGDRYFEDNHDLARSFIPILCTICEHLSPFLVIGAHSLSFLSIRSDSPRPLEAIDTFVESFRDRLPTWLILVLDSALYSALPAEAVAEWAMVDVPCGRDGHLISYSSVPFYDIGELSREQAARARIVFDEQILPHIEQRMINEYSDRPV